MAVIFHLLPNKGNLSDWLNDQLKATISDKYEGAQIVKSSGGYEVIKDGYIILSWKSSFDVREIRIFITPEVTESYLIDTVKFDNLPSDVSIYFKNSEVIKVPVQ